MNIRLGRALTFACILGGGTWLAAAGENRSDSSPVPTGETKVPIRWFGGTPVVQAKINDHGPHSFVFDTGAQGAVLDMVLAEKLKLPVVGNSELTSPGGKGVPAKVVCFDLEIGGRKVKGMTAVAFDRARLYRDANAPEGVLSAKMFPGSLVTFEMAHDLIRVRVGELPAADGKSIFACDPKESLFALSIDVAGKPARVHIDTGAPVGITLPLALAKELPLASKPRVVGRARRVDRELVVWGAKLKGAVTIGRHVIADPELRFEDSGTGTGQIGNKILRRFALTVDSKNSRIELEETK